MIVYSCKRKGYCYAVVNIFRFGFNALIERRRGFSAYFLRKVDSLFLAARAYNGVGFNSRKFSVFAAAFGSCVLKLRKIERLAVFSTEGAAFG